MIMFPLNPDDEKNKKIKSNEMLQAVEQPDSLQSGDGDIPLHPGIISRNLN